MNSSFITLLFRCLLSASALTGSPQYSDDFEEGDSGKEQQVCNGRFLGYAVMTSVYLLINDKICVSGF